MIFLRISTQIVGQKLNRSRDRYFLRHLQFSDYATGAVQSELLLASLN